MDNAVGRDRDASQKEARHDTLWVITPAVTRSMIVVLAVAISLTIVVSLVQAGLEGRWNATDLQLQNADLSPNHVTFHFYTGFGFEGYTFGDTLAGQQSKVYSPTFQVIGTVNISHTGHVLGVVTHADRDGSAQWPLIDDARLDKTAYVPQFDVSPSKGEAARLTVHNLEALAASVVISFYNASGTVIDTYTTTLPSLGAVFLDPVTMGLPSTFHASARVQSNRNLYVGVDRLSTGLGNDLFAAAQAPSRAGYQLAAPLFTQDSIFVVQNAGPVNATIVMTYFNQAGAPLSTTTVSLAPYAAFDWVGSVVHTATFGSIVATANQPIVALVLNDHLTFVSMDRADYTALVISPAAPDGLDRQTAYAPAIGKVVNGWSSDIAVVNLGQGAAQVLIKYASTPTRTLFSTQMSLPLHGMTIFPASALPSGFGRGAAKISSNQRIAAMVRAGNPQLQTGDALMMYEAPYAPGVIEWVAYLPLVLKNN